MQFLWLYKAKTAPMQEIEIIIRCKKSLFGAELDEERNKHTRLHLLYEEEEKRALKL